MLSEGVKTIRAAEYSWHAARERTAACHVLRMGIDVDHVDQTALPGQVYTAGCTVETLPGAQYMHES